jgi:hypothetical protein
MLNIFLNFILILLNKKNNYVYNKICTKIRLIRELNYKNIIQKFILFIYKYKKIKKYFIYKLLKEKFTSLPLLL